MGGREPEAIQRAFAQGATLLNLPDNALSDWPREKCGLHAVDEALDRVMQATPQIKKRVLGACAAVIGADLRVTVAEAELLRAIADYLDCPMPPILAQHVGGGEA